MAVAVRLEMAVGRARLGGVNWLGFASPGFGSVNRCKLGGLQPGGVDRSGFRLGALLMPRKRTTPARPYGKGKKLKAFRCTEKTSRLLKRAAKKAKISEAAYIEAALEDRFRKDGLLAPEEGLVKLILEDRES